MANSSTDSIGSFSAEKLDQNTRDIFHGNALIDRLLVYFSKFEGSREKARKYAQKLLDLGHIESLLHSTVFEDSLREYRWTDVASVVNKARAKAQENGAKCLTLGPVLNESLPQVSSIAVRKEGRPTLRISIEADNCDGAEIEAHIRTNPNAGSVAKTMRTSKSGDTVCLAEVQNGKMISFTTEMSKTEEVLRMVPVSAASQKREIFESKIEKEKRMVAPEERDMKTNFENNVQPQNFSDVDSAVEVDKATTEEESSPIVKASTPGKGGTSLESSTFFENQSQEPIQFSPIKDSPRKSIESSMKSRQGIHKYKWENTTEESGTDNIRDDAKGRNSSSCSSVRYAESDSKSASRSGTSSATESGRSTPEQTGKLKFKNDSDWIKIRREYLDCEEIRQVTERSYEHVELFDDPGVSLHSGGNQETIQEVSEPEDESNEDIAPGKAIPKQEKNQRSAPPPIVIISPPPSTPTSPRKSVDLGIKSLFWTKIKCGENIPEETEGIFWLNVEKDIQFDESDFTRVFSKPSQSPLQKCLRKVVREENSSSKNLKVLETERSRLVGIRASSVHLQTEDIHDAIVNMDDSALSLDALEALFDVRPTSEELDDIADALKRNPNAILDKPEQFVLMLAMISNLDERLKCWIFLKKFPDKVLDLKDQLNAISNVCIQIVRNTVLQRLLEATLVFGNFMNKGTQRGDADGYFLDILPKLKDVKSQGGDSNLMLYLVRWMIAEREKTRSSRDIKQRRDSTSSDLSTEGQEEDCGLPCQADLQKACATSLQDAFEDIESLLAEMNECKDRLIPSVIEGATCLPEIKPFSGRMQDFTQQAEKALAELQSLARETSEIAEEFKRYYVPVDAKSESLTNMMRHLSSFCLDFRFYWDEEKRNAAKEAFFNTEKARRQRIAAVKIAKSPSTLKARFLEKRRRERTTVGERVENDNLLSGTSKSEHVPSRFNSRANRENGDQEASGRVSTPLRPQPTSHPRQNIHGIHSKPNSSRISNGHFRPEKFGPDVDKNTVSRDTPARMSRMKQAMMKRKMLLKSKTC